MTRTRSRNVVVEDADDSDTQDLSELEIAALKAKEKRKKGESEFDAVSHEIEKRKGKNVVRNANELPLFNNIPTGAFLLDFATLGGIPEGLATMIYGPEGSGKTTLSARCSGNILRKYKKDGGRGLWLDGETTFDAGWAKKHGMNTQRVKLCQPRSGEEAVDIACAYLYAEETRVIVVDSIPSLVPMAIKKKSAEDRTMTELARLMGIFCSKITSSWADERKRGHYVTVIFINQLRSGIGMFAPPTVLPGGKQINYFCTTKVRLTGKEVMGKDKYDNDTVTELKTLFKMEKAKIGMSIRSGEWDMSADSDHPLGLGVMLEAPTVCVYAKRMDLIKGGGASWRIHGIPQKFRKLAEMETYLYSHPKEFRALKQQIIALQRVDKGLPALPPDGYLLGWDAKKNVRDLFNAADLETEEED